MISRNFKVFEAEMLICGGLEVVFPKVILWNRNVIVCHLFFLLFNYSFGVRIKFLKDNRISLTNSDRLLLIYFYPLEILLIVFEL